MLIIGGALGVLVEGLAVEANDAVLAALLGVVKRAVGALDEALPRIGGNARLGLLPLALVGGEDAGCFAFRVLTLRYAVWARR